MGLSSTSQVPSISPPPTEELRAAARESLKRCGVQLTAPADTKVTARTPITGEDLFDVEAADRAQVESAISDAKAAFQQWRVVPAPVRGALVKRLGVLLAEHKADVANLITLEAGKIPSEAAVWFALLDVATGKADRGVALLERLADGKAPPPLVHVALGQRVSWIRLVRLLGMS